MTISMPYIITPRGTIDLYYLEEKNISYSTSPQIVFAWQLFMEKNDKY